MISLIAVVLSFAGGFLLANSINRAEMEKLRSENERAKNEASAAVGANESALAPEEIDAKLAEADRNPENGQFQKSLGTALYRYAATKQDTDLLEKAIRLLDRAASLDKSDRGLLVSLGNAQFDLGYYLKQNDSLVRARNSYQRALDQDPDDVEVRTDLGLTYFLQEPPALDAAVREFEQSLKQEPQNARTLQFLIQALVKQNRTADAAAYLDRLKAVDPSDPSIAGLSSMISRGGQGTK